MTSQVTYDLTPDAGKLARQLREKSAYYQFESEFTRLLESSADIIERMLSELDAAREENERLAKLNSKLRDRLDRMFTDWIQGREISPQTEALAHSLLSATHAEMGE